MKKHGAFYSYQDLKLGQGRDKSIEFLEVNRELRDEIENKIREFASDSDTPILQFVTGEEDDEDGVNGVSDNDDEDDFDFEDEEDEDDDL